MHFEKAIEEVETLEIGDAFIPYILNGTARKIHDGPPSLLSVIIDDLSCIVFETRQCGIQLSTHIIHQEACYLLSNF
jgi:hypothetical protein